MSPFACSCITRAWTQEGESNGRNGWGWAGIVQMVQCGYSKGLEWAGLHFLPLGIKNKLRKGGVMNVHLLRGLLDS